MNFIYSSQFEYLLRVVLAGLCGGIIGYERKNRMKEAGIRTHFIVCLSAALMMIVSKYGFQDQINIDNISIDPSRIAAQVVSGVGFLGAGMIFMRRQSVKGLTTAAGVWATSGVGIAIGSGLYFIGILSSVIIVVAQTILHRDFSWLSTPRTENLTLKMLNNEEAISLIKTTFDKEGIEILNFKAKKLKNQDLNEPKTLEFDFILKVPDSYEITELLYLIQSNPDVKYVEI